MVLFEFFFTISVVRLLNIFTCVDFLFFFLTGVYVSGAKLVEEDVSLKNGVLHIINKLL